MAHENPNQNPDEPETGEVPGAEAELDQDEAIDEGGVDTDTAPGGADEQVTQAGAENDSEELTVDDILSAASAEVDDPTDEHLADLKRVTAEYANYRKRTEANREVERERAVSGAIAVLLPVLDDLDRAEKHGDLGDESAFATIAAKLRAATERLGLARFGEVGDAFDPQYHEAIFQQPSDEVEVETVGDVVETGYTLGSTLVRAAKVVVKTPA